nr:hypothetical protein [Tanacetum cinerariifolium]
MKTLKFDDTHNIVAFLEKPTKSEGFEQIVNFLSAHILRYALTVNPTIYDSSIEQFWSTAKTKTINREAQIHAQELDDSLVRAATTASSLKAKQDGGNIERTQSKVKPIKSSSQGTDSGGGPMCQEAMGDTIAQTRFKNVSKQSNDSLVARDEQILGQDASKQDRRIDDIDGDEDITLVNDQNDVEMFDVCDAGKVNAASIVTTVSAAVIVTTEEITLAQALVEINTSKPKAKGIVLQDPNLRTELVEGSSKRAVEELTQEGAKKQNMDDDKETAELKQLMEIIPDEEEVAIDAIPLAVKSLRIVAWKIYKEGKKSY